MQQFLLKNLIGQRGLDLTDTISIQIRLPRCRRPRHHVNMGMITLIMEGSVPAEVLRLDVHSGSDVVPMSAQKCAPRRCVVVAQPCGILPLQRDDVRPHVAGVVFQFVYGRVQRHMIRIAEQAVTAALLWDGWRCTWRSPRWTAHGSSFAPVPA